MHIVRSIRSEFIKLKYLPILSLCSFTLLSVLAIVFTAHFVEINSAVELGRNPWLKISRAAIAIFSVFMVIPFTVLLISATVFLEFQSNAWKFLYTVPMQRSTVFFGKLIAIIGLFCFSLVVLILGVIVVGYLLNGFYPEMEFTYYAPKIIYSFKMLSHTFIALLGVIGIQYFLSHRFKGFLIPASVGILAFIVGLILATTDNPMALYFPYSFPTVVQDYGMFRIENIGVESHGWINNVEVHSLIYFVIFLLLGTFMEYRNKVK